MTIITTTVKKSSVWKINNNINKNIDDDNDGNDNDDNMNDDDNGDNNNNDDDKFSIIRIQTNKNIEILWFIQKQKSHNNKLDFEYD